MASAFISRSKPYHTVYHAVILGWYQFQVPRFTFYETEFILFNNRVQPLQKVLYLVEQMALVVEENIVPLWCNPISHCKYWCQLCLVILDSAVTVGLSTIVY
eukprot:232486_1